jgi:DNA-binding transcriptional ArsR family regulator
MKPRSDISDPRVIKALTHPLRIQILRSLEERTASPSELADEIGAPLGNVSYHVRQLHGLGLIKLVKKTPRRGAIEHHYKALAQAPISDEAWAGTPGLVKESVVGESLGQLGRDVTAAAAGGGFKRAEAQLVREQLDLDARGFADVAKELTRTRERLEKIRTDAAKRLEKAGEGAASASVALILFEAAGGGEAAAAAAPTNGSSSKSRSRAKR